MSSSAFSPPVSKAALLADLRERPVLLLMELLWRWGCGSFLLLLAGYDAMRIWAASETPVRATGIFSLTGDSLLSHPTQLSTALLGTLAILRPQVERAAWGLAPLVAFCWIAAFGLGRAAVLRRYDSRMTGRAWLLAECEALRVGLLVAASLGWGVLVHLAGVWTLDGMASNVLLYILLVLVVSGVLLAAWARVAKTVELAMALGVAEMLPLAQAFGKAWRAGGAGVSPRLRQVRQSARHLRIWFFAGALVLSCVPAPVATGGSLVGWWVLVSLATLAAADALRLGVQFAMIRALREQAAPIVPDHAVAPRL